VPASTLHVWERAGLIESVARNGLRRQYAGDVIDRIALIVLGKRSGFSLDEIADLFAPDAFATAKNCSNRSSPSYASDERKSMPLSKASSMQSRVLRRRRSNAQAFVPPCRTSCRFLEIRRL